MNTNLTYRDINTALEANDVQKAMDLVQKCQAEGSQDATLYLLEGKVHLRRSDWRQAQNAFLKADELEPEGTAAQYLHMLADIMNFYNKDMYNQ